MLTKKYWLSFGPRFQDVWKLVLHVLDTFLNASVNTPDLVGFHIHLSKMK